MSGARGGGGGEGGESVGLACTQMGRRRHAAQEGGAVWMSA